MTVNGATFSTFQFDAATGNLVATINLVRGDNNVVISVENSAGDAEAVRKVVF
jgi:hypothetical protein